MNKLTYILSFLVLILSVWVIILWMKPSATDKNVASEARYGVIEGLQLVEQTMLNGGKQYLVEDAKGDIIFRVPLSGCLLDTHFRNGKLRFREMATGREGYIDKSGNISFISTAEHVSQHEMATQEGKVARVAPETEGVSNSHAQSSSNRKEVKLPQTDIRKLARSNPFYAEATKIINGKLSVTDASRRKQILNYCEHFRTAYTTKDIDFLWQVFSDEALIIVGNIVRPSRDGEIPKADGRVNYAIHSKHEYLSRLSKVFAGNKKVDVRFSDFRIMRHPTMDGIYGVTLRQRYQSDRYADDGYLFLLWDFRNPSMPLIHVRTWQPSSIVGSADEVIGISDFNLE